MIKLNHIDKYYNRHKRNELHILNEVSLTFEQQGLVVLLGPSGSGKTTLLNVLGGLDRFQNGTMNFADKTIQKYRSKQFDDIRLNDVGIVFQNYYLIPNLSVYENIAMTLRVIGITNEALIEERIDYVLNAVNMKNYKKRKASQLSGGQQQRVAIARALVKNPQVILADEPTGNLDSKNTYEIMRIIKAISKEKLVIMVTHERKLAHYFADRIIEIEDGKIAKDDANISTGEIDYDTETEIYLKDLNPPINLQQEPVNLRYYNDLSEDKPLNVTLVLKNKTLYLTIDNDEAKKVVVLDDKSEIKLLDASQTTKSETTEKPLDFEIAKLKLPEEKQAKKSVIDLKQVFSQTVGRILDASRGSRLLYLGFAIGAMIMAYAISSLLLIVTVDDEEILRMPKETIVIPSNQIATLDEFLLLRELDFVNDINFMGLNYTNMRFPTIFLSGRGVVSGTSVDTRFVPSTLLNEAQISHGRLPENDREIVVDQAWIDRFARYNDTLNSLNLAHPQAMLNLVFTIQNPLIGDNQNYPFDFTIVGVSQTLAPVIYTSELAMYQLASFEYLALDFFDEAIDLVAGTLPSNKNEILLPYNDLLEFRIDDLPFTHTDFYGSYTVTGFYTLSYQEETIHTIQSMLTKEAMREHMFNRRIGQFEYYVYVNNVTTALNHFEAEGIEANHIYTLARQEYFQRNLNIGNLVFTSIAILASGLSFYFIIRSSMISRIYELGVYRSLGIKKPTIIKRFIVESVVITTFSSLIGLLLMNYIIYSAQNAVSAFTRVGYVTLPSILLGIVIIYSINILSGVIPIANLLRKTPAEINTQYDL